MIRRLLADPTAFPARAATRIGRSLVAAALGWVTLFAWRGLIEEPNRLLQGALLGGLMIAVVGGVLRARRVGWPLVFLAQVLVLFAWVQSRSNGRSGPGAWIPSPDGIRRTVDVIVQGAADVNKYASPVSTRHPDAVEYLLVLGLAVILAIDLFGIGLRRSPWAGLPVVIALTVPVSVLDDGLSWVVFGACALLFVLLLAGDETERIRVWARRAGGSSADLAHAPVRRQDAGATSLRATAAGIGAVAALAAFVLPAFVPVTDGFAWEGGRFGSGDNGRKPVNLTNPMVDLHRDLTAGGNTPLITATTSDPDHDYLRLTVLDSFDGERWKPSKRDLPSENKATTGSLTQPPGLNAISPGENIPWSLRITEDFESAWLATPYPLARILARTGDWRYDARTLDFIRVDEKTGQGVEYELSAMHPRYDATALENAAPPPAGISEEMTRLPDGLPDALAEIAAEVTSTGESAYARAVLLQNWFRRDGGFTYSLEPDPGNSGTALERFITTDKIGYCEQFAAAMALMARTLDIPARVVVGFLRPESVEGAELEYTADGLHAWPELYFEGSGWVRFEPTPPRRTGTAPAWTRSLVAPTVEPTTQPSAAPVRPSARPTIERDAGDDAARGTGSSPPYAYLALGAAVVVLVAIPGLARRRRRLHRLAADVNATGEAVAGALWTELLATAVDLRLALPWTRSIRVVAEALMRVVRPVAEDRAALEELVLLLERSRYGRPGPISAEEHERMAAHVRRWSQLLRGIASRRGRIEAAIAPRSVLTRGSVRAPATERTDAGELSGTR